MVMKMLKIINNEVKRCMHGTRKYHTYVKFSSQFSVQAGRDAAGGEYTMSSELS